MAVKRIGVLCFFTTIITVVFCYKPVIIVHGLFEHPSSLSDLANFIKSAHPSTNITVIDIYDELLSFVPLWKQIKGFTEKARPVMQEASEGVHVIGFSQGGLVARGMLESMSDHNVDTFISLSSPQMGQYGDSSYLKPYLPTTTVEKMYKFFYTYIAQRTISVANYWNDPYHQDLNLQTNVFLPVINNNKSSSMYNASESEKYKKNFLRIKKLILIGGPDDGVVTPWQSSQFGSFQDFSNVTIRTMKEQEFFKQDSFGLKTLYDKGCVHTFTFSGVKHVHWHGNKQVFVKAIEPWLT